MPLVVQKYGGSSLATPKHIQRAAERIKKTKVLGNQVVVVASAMGHMTDHLLKLAYKTVGTPPKRELDMLLTAGERISMSLLAMCLQERGVPAISFTGSQSGIVTTNDHTEAKILDVRCFRIQEELEKGKVVIIAGFQGVSEQKEITTLGRGGSDTTAVALASALKADRCEILTDVEGLFTADPRLVPRARLIPFCDYEEALEFSHRGAKLHARSVELAKKFGVTLWMSSSSGDGSNHESNRGTIIGKTKEKKEEMSMHPVYEKTQVRGIATRDGFYYFKVDQPFSETSSLAAELGVSIHFFQGANNVSEFLIGAEEATIFSKRLESEGVTFQFLSDVALVSAVGEGIISSPTILSCFLNILKSEGIETLFVHSNTLSIGAAIPARQKGQAALALHAGLVEPSL